MVRVPSAWPLFRAGVISVIVSSTVDPAGITTRPAASRTSVSIVVVTVSPALVLREVMVRPIVASIVAPVARVRVLAVGAGVLRVLSVRETSGLALPQAKSPTTASPTIIDRVILYPVSQVTAPLRRYSSPQGQVPSGASWCRLDSITGGWGAACRRFAPRHPDSDH